MAADKKFVVWDWNGTLLDDTDAILVLVNQVLAEKNYPPISIDFFRETHIRPLANFYRAAGVREADIEPILVREREVLSGTYEEISETLPLRSGAEETLRLLAKNGVANIIVSNHITADIERLLRHNEIEEHFEFVMAYGGHGPIYRSQTKGQKLRDHLVAQGMNGSNAIIVGDTLEEIEIARELGMASVAITGGIHSERRLRELKPDYIVHSVAEMQPILRQHGFLS